MRSQEQRPLSPQRPTERRGSPAQHIYQGIPQTHRVFPNEYQVFDNELAVENLENDVPEADL